MKAKNSRRPNFKVNPILSGTYEGYEWRVCHLWSFPVMQWWTAYVRLPDDHRFIEPLSHQKWSSFASLIALAKKAKVPGYKIPKLEKRHYKRRYRYDYDALPISAHGGLTFGERVSTNKQGKESLQKFTKGFWIGWDYNHAGDDHEIDDISLVPKALHDEWIKWKATQAKIAIDVYGSVKKRQAVIKNHERRWDQEEIIVEVKDVIDQLIASTHWYFPVLDAWRRLQEWWFWKRWHWERKFKKLWQ